MGVVAQLRPTTRPSRHYSDDPEEPVFFYGSWFSSFEGGPFLFEVRAQWPEATVLPPVVEAKRAEYPFQAAKGRKREHAEWVLSARTPVEAKRRGRRTPLRDDWEAVKYEIMLHVQLAKFRQLPLFRKQLLATGDRYLAEDSPTDYVWGIRDARGGLAGENLLGQVLMRVRDELRS